MQKNVLSNVKIMNKAKEYPNSKFVDKNIRPIKIIIKHVQSDRISKLLILFC